jgi:hypothetical protein
VSQGRVLWDLGNQFDPESRRAHSWRQKCIIINEGANAEKFEATTPTQTIPAKGGDSVTLDWQQWPDSHIGGQAVYMAVSPVFQGLNGIGEERD